MRGTNAELRLNENDVIVPSREEDEMFLRLRREAASVVHSEPILAMLLSKVGLLDHDGPSSSSCAVVVEPAGSFEEAISRIVSHRLSSCSGKTESICPDFLRRLLEESFRDDDLEMGHTMTEAVREDALAILRRDPACETLLEAVLFMKGFHSLVIHRAARRAWRPAATEMSKEAGADQANVMAEGGVVGSDGGRDYDDPAPPVEGKRFVALLLQSLASSAFGVDIHPASSIGAGIMIDHATGVVIGETAAVGDGTTILHGVVSVFFFSSRYLKTQSLILPPQVLTTIFYLVQQTLGGTGKESGDRHPKIGKHVLIGAGTQILGNITVGDRAKIGAGSVVLRPIPSGATAVGAPARIIGFTASGELPGSMVDMNLEGVEPHLGDRRKSLRYVTMSLIHAKRHLLKKQTTTERGSTDETTEEGNNSPETKSSDETNGGRAGDSEESTSTEDEKDRGSGEEEEDDNVTDYCRSLCPFSGSFPVIPSSIKKNCISHKQLRELLTQEGCSEGECVEVYFELLHCTPASSDFRPYGCIPLEIFSSCFAEIAKEKTRLDADRVQALAEGDIRKLGLSKKASRRFKSMLNRLGASTISRTSSSGSISKDKKRLGKSERERMENFLDVSACKQGISI